MRKDVERSVLLRGSQLNDFLTCSKDCAVPREGNCHDPAVLLAFFLSVATHVATTLAYGMVVDLFGFVHIHRVIASFEEFPLIHSAVDSALATHVADPRGWRCRLGRSYWVAEPCSIWCFVVCG